MADLMFNISKVEVSDDGTVWTDLGATNGGATFSQSIETQEIYSDQSADPVEIMIRRAPKTVRVNLLNASADNLALAFAGTASDTDADSVNDKVTIPKLPSGITKQVKITTQSLNGYHYEILIKKGKITGESEISLSNNDATTIPLNIQVLEPDDASDPVEISKVAG